MTVDTPHDVAVLGGGCFWCTEAVFTDLEGVLSVTSGYCGGNTVDPTYEQICTGQTGHAECVRVTFAQQTLSYADLLQVFFHTHDPTTLNRQGNDIGTQYRSVIFYQNEDQQCTAAETIKALDAASVFSAPIVTQLCPSAPFYVAETYHQQYFAGHPAQPYCSAVVGPKVRKCREQFSHLLKK